jgi:tetratricopeptide (TPR) repeat protein
MVSGEGTKRIILTALLWAACAGPVQAQEQGGKLYIDDDPAAAAFHPPPGMKGKFRIALNQAIQNNPRNVTALVHRAYLLQNAGDAEQAQRDWDAAVDAAPRGSVLERRVLWSRGWASYDAGNFADAMQSWQRAVQLHGGAPYWAAYTFALGHAALGQMDQAVGWTETAVQSNLEWGSEQGFETRTRHWRAPQRAMMRTVFDAWTARRTVPARP